MACGPPADVAPRNTARAQCQFRYRLEAPAGNYASGNYTSVWTDLAARWRDNLAIEIQSNIRRLLWAWKCRLTSRLVTLGLAI